MKKVLLIINGPHPPFSEFADMFKPLVESAGQFEVEISDDRNRLTDPSAFDAVALYIGGGEITPEVERGLTGYVRGGGGLLAVHGANAGLGQYDDYIELIGTEFIQHDPLAPFEVTTEDGFDDILPRLNKQFRIVDECYQMKVRTDAPLRYFQYGAWRLQKYPLGYVRDYGDGKVFYTALGHDDRAFGHSDFQDQLLKGLRYVTDLKDNPPIRIGLVGYGPAI